VPRDDHAVGLAALGVPAGQVPPLARYLELVESWNQRTNLTGATTPEERVRVLVADPWRASAIVAPGTLIDVGSGNGSPGLVLALLRPDLQVTLLEPRARRWAFLREVARLVGRLDIRVERARCDEFGGQARTVTVRALGLGLSELADRVEPGGELLLFGRQEAEGAGLRYIGSQRLESTSLYRYQRGLGHAVSRET
jgi:16S rRNA (guanine(527)-N(7))-methyltransferase RsmG